MSQKQKTEASRMDLFDCGSFFGCVVPQKAASIPLLKYAACACAAKQLGRVKITEAHPPAFLGGPTSFMRGKNDQNGAKVDWIWLGASYYDKAISLLMKALQHDRAASDTTGALESFDWEEPAFGELILKRRMQRRLSNSWLSLSRSDELVAATAILCMYEFLDASGAAWSRHLSGTKSLLDAESEKMPPQFPLERSLLGSPGHHRTPSKARKATFWNFARQDFLAACESSGNYLLFLYTDCQTSYK